MRRISVRHKSSNTERPRVTCTINFTKCIWTLNVFSLVELSCLVFSSSFPSKNLQKGLNYFIGLRDVVRVFHPFLQ